MSSLNTASLTGDSVHGTAASNNTQTAESSSRRGNSLNQGTTESKDSEKPLGEQTVQGRSGPGARGRGRGRGGRGWGRGRRERNRVGESTKGDGPDRDDKPSQTKASEGSTAGGSSIPRTVMTDSTSTQADSAVTSIIGGNRLKNGWPLKNASDMKDQIWSTITSLIELYLGHMKKLGTDQYKEVIERCSIINSEAVADMSLLNLASEYHIWGKTIKSRQSMFVGS